MSIQKNLAVKQVSCDEYRSLIRHHHYSTEIYVEAKRLDEDSKGIILITAKW